MWLLERRAERQPAAASRAAVDAQVGVGPLARQPAQRCKPLVRELGGAAAAASGAPAVVRVGRAVEDELLRELL